MNPLWYQLLEYCTILRRGGWISIVYIVIIKTIFNYLLKHRIKKIHKTQILSWNPNWENQQLFLYCKITFTIVFSSYEWQDATTPYLLATTRGRLRPPGFINFYLKDATTPFLPATTGTRPQTPCFISCYWKNAMTPYLPATTRSRLEIPCRLVACPSTTLPPYYVFITSMIYFSL